MVNTVLKQEFDDLVQRLNELFDRTHIKQNPNLNNQLNRAYHFSVMKKKEYNDGKITREYNQKFKSEIERAERLSKLY